MASSIVNASTEKKLGFKVEGLNEHRRGWTDEMLRPHYGKWVAFSGDGRDIVASSPTLLDLEQQLAAIGHNPQDFIFEHLLYAEDSCFGGAELERS